MADEIGMVKSVTSNSMELNGQAGQGAVKMKLTGADGNPGGTKPSKPSESKVAMPK